MRCLSLLFFVSIISIYRVAAECCGTDGVSSCCSAGAGSCNIYCCNCEQGCAPKETCPDRCLSLCTSGCPPAPSDPSKWKWADQQCIVACNNQCPSVEYTQEDIEEDLQLEKSLAWRLARNVFKRGVEMSDEEMFREADAEGKGHFTYEQFLIRQGWRDGGEARAHFERHDVNGDRVIEVGEMRVFDFYTR